LNVVLDRSGHGTVEIICFFIMSGLKYHNLYMCIKAQTCLCCKLLQHAAIFFLYFVSLFSVLMASGNPFQTVAMAARRVPDYFCGGKSPFSRFLVILVLCGQINRPPANGNSCPLISMPIWILAASDTALRHISPTDVGPVKLTCKNCCLWQQLIRETHHLAH
jgi:hypothetical protein